MRPEKPAGHQFSAWWQANRDRVSILAIAAVALGGMFCLVIIVLVLIWG